jgi:chitinase
VIQSVGRFLLFQFHHRTSLAMVTHTQAIASMNRHSHLLARKLLLTALTFTSASAAPIVWPTSEHDPSAPATTIPATHPSPYVNYSPVDATQADSLIDMTDLSNGTGYLNGGYWPSWKEDVSDVCLDPSTLTHINYAFASIQADATIFVDNSQGLYAWSQYKSVHTDLKVSLAVGGGSEAAKNNFAVMAANPGMVDLFVASAKSIVDQFGLDGIDIDWEYPNTPEQGQQFLNVINKLRLTLPQPLRISTALPASEPVLRNIPLAELANHVDILNLMAYDFVGATFANVVLTGYHSNLFSGGTGGVNGAAAVDYIASQGFPANKILLGIPLYARSFGNAGWINEKFTGAGTMEELPVKELPKAGMEEFFDTDAVAVFAVGDGQFITYDNAQSVGRKAEYVKTRGLGGLFFWQLTADRCGEQSLVRAGFNGMNN